MPLCWTICFNPRLVCIPYKCFVLIHDISVIIANKRQEEKLATSTFNIWMCFKSMLKYDGQVTFNNFCLVSSSTGGNVRDPISGYLGMFSAMRTPVRLLVCLHFKEKAPTKHRLKCLKDGTLKYATGPNFTIHTLFLEVYKLYNIPYM